jgi:hypothetical protein
MLRVVVDLVDLIGSLIEPYNRRILTWLIALHEVVVIKKFWSFLATSLVNQSRKGETFAALRFPFESPSDLPNHPLKQTTRFSHRAFLSLIAPHC